MKKVRFLMIGLIFVILFFTMATPNTLGATKKGWPSGITIGSASMGSTYFVLLSGVGDCITRHTGIKTAVEATGGPASNIGLIERGELEMGAATNLVLHQGWHGTAWAKGKQYRRLRAILPMYPGTFHGYALKKSGIKSIEDFNGKKVSTGPSTTTVAILSPSLWEILGVKPGKVIHIGWTDLNNALRDGIVDAAQTVTGVPQTSVVELGSTHDLNIFTLPKEDIAKVLKELPILSPTTIPANTYKGQTEDLPTFAVWGFILASKDLPDDMVYEVVKTIAEKGNELLAVHRNARYITQLESIVHSVVPVHSGAIKYYKEVGIDIPKKLIPAEYK